MIGLINGTVAWRGGNEVIVDVNGVGYELTLSSAAGGICGAIGSSVKLIVYTDVRENAINLFGFGDMLERQVFLLTRKVKGVGSKTALAIISSLGAEGLLVAIGQQNVGILQSVPGIGKKTAERLVVELREQVGNFVDDSSFSPEKNLEISNIQVQRGGNGLTLMQSDAMLALEKLGVSADKARQAVTLAVSGGSKFNSSGDLVKLALANL